MRHVEKHSVTEALRRSLVALIPEGRVSSTARKAGMNHGALFALLRGEKLNIRIGTLARLAVALGKTPNELLEWQRVQTTQQADAAEYAENVSARVLKQVEPIGRDSENPPPRRAVSKLSRLKP